MKLAIVTGVNGALGSAYLAQLAAYRNIQCVGISRSQVNDKISDVTYIDRVDLLDAEAVRRKIDREVPFSNSQEVIFVHPVGRFKFEENKAPEGDLDGDGIDDEVFNSNVRTFENVEKPLIDSSQQCGTVNEIVLCGFGSVSDKYKVPYWKSYSLSKDQLRMDIAGKARKGGHGLRYRGIFVNVSSVNTGNENKLRPNADTTNWLQAEEIVDDTIQLLTREGRIRNLEVDIFKPIPQFDPDVYYSEDEVWKRWMREMGREEYL